MIQINRTSGLALRRRSAAKKNVKADITASHRNGSQSMCGHNRTEAIMAACAATNRNSHALLEIAATVSGAAAHESIKRPGCRSWL
ncbi:MAG TPA: hypothetical protein VNX61_05830 [Rhizomicrobium sp.]|nr:hypothetical protein [Rhizomicrobium sp.]